MPPLPVLAPITIPASLRDHFPHRNPRDLAAIDDQRQFFCLRVIPAVAVVRPLCRPLGSA